MSRALRIAVKMQAVPDGAGGTAWNATLPMAVLFEKSLDTAQLEQERLQLQEKYRTLVETVRQLRGTSKRKSALDSWMLGDAIVTFEQETSKTLLFIDGLTEHLSRDVEYSKRMIDLCRRFRLHLPDKSRIDPTVPFSAYHRSGFDPARARAVASKQHKSLK